MHRTDSNRLIDLPHIDYENEADMTVNNSGDPIHTTKAPQGDPYSESMIKASADPYDTKNHLRGDPATENQRLIDQWLNQYSLCHQNPLNKKIHYLCVPLIVLSILGLLWSIPMPQLIASLGTWFNAATLVIILVSLYYIRLSPRLAIGMGIAALASIFMLEHTEQLLGVRVWQASILLFVLAWVGQFIGHHIEGKRPAFANDLQFLLIGPLWILADLYRRLGMTY